MMIVLEGPDASGKSTLAEKMAKHMRLPLITNTKPTSAEELNARCERYLGIRHAVFDRHPAVSENIYGPVLRGKSILLPSLTDEFYRRRPILVYCRNVRGLESQALKDHDTPEYLSELQLHHGAICAQYDDWALSRAHIVYRIGDDSDRVIDMVLGFTKEYA